MEHQKPLILQPIWKTLGKSPKLADNCLDVFVWSDLAFTRLFIDATDTDLKNAVPVKLAQYIGECIVKFKKNEAENQKLQIDNIGQLTLNI